MSGARGGRPMALFRTAPSYGMRPTVGPAGTTTRGTLRGRLRLPRHSISIERLTWGRSVDTMGAVNAVPA